MNPYHILGLLILASPVIVFVVALTRVIGWKDTLLAIACSIATGICFVLGSWLLSH